MTETEAASPIGQSAGEREQYIRRLVAKANLNALRMALIEETNDPALTAIVPIQREIRGGAMQVTMLAREDRAIVTECAVTYLTGKRVHNAFVGTDRARELLALFGQPFPTRADQDLAIDDLGISPPVEPSVAFSRDQIGGRSVAIIGAGISGIALALRLQRLGIPCRIYERQAGIGGTWHLNDYPEARVDISTFIYQFRSERNYAWSELFAQQREIKTYLESIVDKYGLRDQIELGTSVTRALWDAETRCWALDLERADGSCDNRAATFLISAAGLFSTPNVPKIRGLDEFEGAAFHTTDWPQDLDLTDKRVALVGNGSSGVQIMPWLSRTASKLTIFQRSPNWMTPVEDYRDTVSPELHALFKELPSYWHWHCFAMSALDKQLEQLQVLDPEWQANHGGFNARNAAYREYLEGYISEQLNDRPDLLAQSIPSYPPLARRMVVDSGWFQALKRPNVELVSCGIDHFDATGAIAADGRHHEFDAVVLGTGFKASEFLRNVEYRGEGGQTLDALWVADGARAHLGMFLPGFPNFAIFYGPNGQPQSGSFHDWADRSARLVMKMISQVIMRDAKQFQIPKDVYERYNRDLDEGLRAMIWGRDGATGYYVNAQGRPITKMPWPAADYFERLQQAPHELSVT